MILFRLLYLPEITTLKPRKTSLTWKQRNYLKLNHQSWIFPKLFNLFLQNQKQKQQVHNSLTAISLFILLQRLSLHRSNQNLPQYLSHSQVLSLSQIQGLGQIHLVLILRLVRSLLHSLVHNLVHSQIHSPSQSRSQSSSQKKEKQGQNSGRRSHSGRGLSSDKHGKGSDDPIKMAN